MFSILKCDQKVHDWTCVKFGMLPEKKFACNAVDNACIDFIIEWEGLLARMEQFLFPIMVNMLMHLLNFLTELQLV